jgi:hypothetical protein
MPLAIAAGLKRIAFVTAAPGLGKLTVEDLVPTVNGRELQSRPFESMPAARNWLSGLQAANNVKGVREDPTIAVS